MPRSTCTLALLFVLFAVPAVAAASPWEEAGEQRWRFPERMGVVDVKEAFGAVGDGETDDTEALQQAFDQSSAFVYLPDGRYLIREPLQYTQGPGNGPTIQGESRDGVIIKLADDAAGFDDPENPRAAIRLIRDGDVSADYFKTKIRNLTIDTGIHRGAVGLMFYANNNGQARNLRIVGEGLVGLDLSYRLNGPLLASNIAIEGFDVGIKGGSGPYNSQTLEHIVLRNQRQWGIHNDGEAMFIRDLRSENDVPAIFTRGGSMVLIDSELAGGSADEPAIVCAGRLFARNVATAGYAHAIRQHAYDRQSGLGAPAGEPVPAGHVAEWVSHPDRTATGWGDEPRSLGLPVEPAPYQPLPTDEQRWVFVDDFGADGTDEQDDTEAVRAALAEAREIDGSVVAFSAEGTYIVSGELAIDGGIARLQGANTFLRPARGASLRFVIGEGLPEVVSFSMIDRPLGRWDVTIEHASSRTLVVHHFRTAFVGSGPGRSFLEDASSNVELTHGEHRAWVRQLNSESGDVVNNVNAGGTLWVFGLKTERDQTLVRTTDGGQTEVLGAWVYQTHREAPSVPMFDVTDSQASFAGILPYNWQGNIYPVLVEARQGDAVRRFTAEENNGGAFLLYSTLFDPTR
ncbi:MAG: glycosyl hydrolase family 28-related protein [Phycisphaeraceae bacterium]